MNDSISKHIERTPEAAVDPLFLERWSPRAFDPEPIPSETLQSLFEAARWAPSCFNERPSGRRGLSEITREGRFTSPAGG